MGRMKDLQIDIIERVESIMENCKDEEYALDFISNMYGEYWKEYAEEHFVVTGIND
jgi:hypothetical protein